MVDVAIIGGGLSGLAAAVDLASSGKSVALFERSLKLGGRCYSYRDEKTGDIVDNGQHVLIGAYRNTLKYLELIGTRHLLKEQSNLMLPLHHPEKGFGSFSVMPLPRPLHLTAAMLKFNLLSLSDRRRLLSVGVELQRWNSAIEEKLSALTVEQWLDSHQQSAEARRCLWYPISISIMNEPPERASALLFAASLRQAFLGKRSDAAILIPTVGQTELYASGAESLLRRNGAKVIVNAEVAVLEVHGSRATGIRLKNGQRICARSVISAVPHFALPKLLPREIRRQAWVESVGRMLSSPIVSIHLWFDRPSMDVAYVGLIGRRVQWLFDRRRILAESGKRASSISAVISGAHGYVDLGKEDLVSITREDLLGTFPESGKAKLLHAIVIKEKRATFSPTVGVERLRPDPQTSIRNFYLAGDWTRTGLAATIEGAVLSGFRAAELARHEDPASPKGG